MTKPEAQIPSIVLGSTSPFRKQLLEKLNLPFIQDSPEVNETPLQAESPTETVMRLAHKKAEVFQEKYPDHIIIASDQCAVFNNKPIGKPHTIENAVAQLSQFSGKAIIFNTAMVVLNTRSGLCYEYLDKTEVVFRELSEAVIRNYVSIEQPLKCAGSFKSEGLGVTLFKQINSRDPNALIGLPLMALTDIFYEMGYPLPMAAN